VGIKPTLGLVSRAGIVPIAHSQDTAGPMARTVADAAALLDAIAGNEPGDPYRCAPPARPFLDEVGADPGRLRVACTTEPPRQVPVDPVCAAAARDAAALLASLGHEVEERTPPWQWEEVAAAFTRIWQTIPTLYGAEAVAQMEPLARALAEQAAAVTAPDYLANLVEVQAFARRVLSFWDEVDLVLTPTLALPPVPVDWLAGEDDPWVRFAMGALFTPFTPVVNVTGQPAASLPLAWSDEGLPIGVQLIARPEDEATLIRVAAQLEAARPWAARRPPLVDPAA
jgi:amidase